MSTNLTHIDFEKRIAELEQQVQRYKTEAVKYKTLFNSFPHGITVSDKHGNILETNAAAEQLLGVDKPEHEKRTIDGQEWRIIRPDGSDMPPEEWASVIALKENRVVTDCEMGILKSQDDIVWINATAAPLPIEDQGVVVTYSDISELKQAKDTLIQHNKRYMDAQRIGKVGNWEYDILKETFWGSDEAKRIYGFDPDSIKFSTDEVEKCIPERERVHQALIDLIEQNKPYNLEFEIHPISGPPKKMIQSVAELSRENSEIIVRGVIQDITDRKNAEVALRESQTRLKERNQLLSAILDHTHMMTVFLDDKFNFIWVNHAYADTCNKPVSFFPGKNHFDLYPHKENQAIFESIVKTGKEYFVAAKPFEFPDQPERGTTYWDWSLRPVTEENGKVTGLVFTLVEVTERIRAEMALQESEFKFKVLVDQAPAALFLHDMDGHIIDVNQATIDSYGYTREQLLKMTAQNIDPDYVVREDQGNFWHELEKLKKVDFEATHRRKDGSIFPVSISLSTVVLKGEKHILALAIDMTENKRQKEELELKSMVLDQIHDHVTITDLNGVITYVNQAQIDAFGNPREKLVGQKTDVYGENSKKSSTQREILEKTLRDGEWRGEVINLSRDGSELIMDCRTQVIFNEKGAPTALCGIASDVTDHRRILERLRLSEARYRAFFEEGPDGVVILDPETGKIVEFNDKACAQLGYSRDEFQGLCLSEIDAIESAEEANQHIQKVLRNGRDDFETRHITKDGKIRWVHVTAQTVFADNECIYHCIWRDITERKFMEIALKESEERYRKLVNTSPYGIQLTDLEGKIIFSNPAHHKIQGYKNGELIGKHIWDLMVDDTHKNKAREHYQQIIREAPVPKLYYNRDRTRDGRDIEVQIDWDYIYDADGKIEGLISIISDITDKKLLENKLQQAQKIESIGTLAGWYRTRF